MKINDLFKKENITRKTVFLTIFVSLFMYSQWLGFVLINESFSIIVSLLMVLIMFVLGFLVANILSMIPFHQLKIPNWTLKMKWKYPKFVMFSILSLVWFTTLLAYYPGIWSYDVGTQINQIMTNSISKYQPIVHTLMVKGVLELGTLLNSYEAAIFIYSLAQLLVLAWSFATLNNFLLKKFNIHGVLAIGLFLFQCFMPMNSIMAISSTKDTLFTALTLFVVVGIFELLDHAKESKINWLEFIQFGLVVALWISFRNNTIFVILPATLLCFILFRKDIKKIGVCFMVSVIMIVSFNGILDALVKPQTYSSIEVLSVPINQISKSALVDDLRLSDQSKTTFTRIFSDSYRYYNPHLSDPVKSRLNFAVSDMGSFVSLWIEILPQAFPDYLSAFLDLNRGSWFLLDVSYARIYLDQYVDGVKIENSNAHQQGYLQTLLEQIIPIHYDSKIPFLYAYYEGIVSDNNFMDNAVLRILFAPALYVWMLIATFFVALYKRNKVFIVVVSIPMLYWLTTLLGPCTLVRYIYPMIALLPLACCIGFGQLKSEGVVDER